MGILSYNVFMMRSAQTSQLPVIPAKAGIHTGYPIDSGFRRNDEVDGVDRLSHAVFFANELNNYRLRKTKAVWTDIRRQKQSLQIQKVKPWRYSTGPKTAQGKARSAANSNKGKRRDVVSKIIRQALQAQSVFIRRVGRVLTLRNLGVEGADNLLERLCRTEGNIVTQNLLKALVF